jgi:hypothetical protein
MNHTLAIKYDTNINKCSSDIHDLIEERDGKGFMNNFTLFSQSIYMYTHCSVYALFKCTRKISTNYGRME